jgi:hypothetical protein
LDVMDQEVLKNAYENNMKGNSESDGDGDDQISWRVVAHPYQLESHADDIQTRSQCDNGRRNSDSCSHVSRQESDTDEMRSDDSLSNAE